MICPYCDHSFPLTWSRYAKSPFGRHTCPACSRVSKFPLTAVYLTFVSIAWIAVLAIAVLMTIAIAPSTLRPADDLTYFVVFGVVGCLVLFPFDKSFDERYRELRRIDPSRK